MGVPDSTSPSLPELIAKANSLKGMRADVIRMVNDLFATIAEVAEDEREGKYGAMIQLAARMQDDRDEALERIQWLETELADVRRSRDDMLARLNDAARDGDPGVKLVAITSAASDLVRALENITERPVSVALEAKIQGDVKVALEGFRTATTSAPARPTGPASI